MNPLESVVEHRSIVKALLLEGKFLLEGDPAFPALKEHKAWYELFFRSTFRLNLQVEADYAFLKDSQDGDKLSRAICIFLAVICYELDQDGKNILESLRYDHFPLADWEDRWQSSSYYPVFEATDKLRDAEDRARFCKDIARRGVIELTTEGVFRFTAAHRYFLAFAREVNVLEMMRTTG